jgi:hypothetical protein
MSLTPGTYGSGLYGSGLYGGTNKVQPRGPQPPDRPTIAQHILGVGPWTDGVAWTAAPNFGLKAFGVYPSQAVLPLSATGIQSATVTLRRTAPSEARIELNQPRGASMVVEEMVTDLWWIRHDPRIGTPESIGRFNASAVDVSMADGRLSTSATFEDHRGMMEGRLVVLGLSVAGWGANTPVTQIMREAQMFPTNINADLSALDTVNLGVTAQPLQIDPPIACTEAIDRLKVVSKDTWDWGFETPITRGSRPVLNLWPGSRGTARGVVLVDDGSAFGPIRTWRRRTNKDDYANFIYFTGKDKNLAQISPKAPAVIDPDVPTGQRDATGNDPDKISAAEVQAAADRMRAEREQRLAAWDITLTPGFWRGRDHIDLGDIVSVVVRMGQELIQETALVEEITVRVSANAPEEVTLTLGWGYPSTDPQSKRHPIAQIIKELRRLDRRRT